MSLVTDEIRLKATELYHGNDVCLAQSKRLLKEVGLPNGLLPLQDIEECGYVEETGFVWVKQKKEIKHKFEKIDKQVSYATEVTAYVEPCKIRKLTGVKAKELFLWVTINEITIDRPEAEKIVFKNNPTGISKVFPADAFVVEETEVAVKGVGTLKKRGFDDEKKMNEVVEKKNEVVGNATNGGGVGVEVGNNNVVKEV